MASSTTKTAVQTLCFGKDTPGVPIFTALGHMKGEKQVDTLSTGAQTQDLPQCLAVHTNNL